jgi:hypothetical protein
MTQERQKRYGLECVGPLGDGITFSAGTWKVGGEYVQKLRIRNVSNTVRKFKYRLPMTRFFSMAYPETTILSPGIESVVDVIFRPTQIESYDDSIYIKLMEGEGSGGFHVPVRAFIPKLSAAVPFGLDLGFCPTEQTTALEFDLVNTGEKTVKFTWQCPPPFVLEPSAGVIPRNTVVKIRASIVPTDASVFVSLAQCFIEGASDEVAEIDEPVLTTRLSAIGKYAYIELSEKNIDYGEQLSGTPSSSLVKEILLRNRSVVPAEFEVLRLEGDNDPLFHVWPTAGMVPALSDMSIKVSYSPLAMGIYHLDHFVFRTPGGCTKTLTTSGCSMPPIVTLRKENLEMPGSTDFHSGSPGNSLNYRDVELGKQSTRVFFLRNHSAQATAYSIDCAKDSTFRIEPASGVIPAFLEVAVTVVFTPKEPMNYYRRYFVLIADALPHFMDCMGTGYIAAKGEIKEQRPAPLRHAHVQAYRNRNMRGVGSMNPDEMDELFDQSGEEEGFAELFAQPGRAGTMPAQVTTSANPLTRTGEAPRIQTAPAHEFFIDDNDASCKDVTLTSSELDFGYCSCHSQSASQTVTVTNNTNGKVTVQWSPADDDRLISQGRAEASVFIAEPSTFDINPGQNKSFKVTFRPHQNDRNYAMEIECFVFFKNQRTFRLTRDHSLTPPWCLPLKVSGNTFASGQLLSSAKLVSMAVSGGKLTFPACFSGETVFQTIIVRNQSNLPCTFRFLFGFGTDTGSSPEDGCSDDKVFAVKPRRGEVAADGFVLVCLRFRPSAMRKYTQMLRCIVNEASGGKLLMEGTGTLPTMRCDSLLAVEDVENLSVPPVVDLSLSSISAGFQGAFYMKPTNVGLSSSRSFTLKNTSRLPCKFRAVLGADAAGVLSVNPTYGVLKGNQQIDLTIAFAPQTAAKYNFKCKFLTFPVAGPPVRVVDAGQPGPVGMPEPLQSLLVNVVAPADVGAVVFSPRKQDFDVMLVDTPDSKYMYVENVSDSDLSYKLYYRVDFMGDPGTNKEAHSSLIPLSMTHRAGQGKAPAPEDPVALRTLNGTGESLFCDEPTGMLPARYRKRINVTFHPTGAGLFEFSIVCRVLATDPNGNVTELPNDEAALLRVSQEDREGLSDRVGGAEDLNEWPLMTHITGRATFPTLVFEDIRAMGDVLVNDVNQLWRNFSFSEINYDLSLSLSDEDTAMNAASSPDLSQLRRFKFEFTPDVLGAPRQEIRMSIKNIGYLPTSFHMHFPNEKELELEPWCNEDEPTEERLRHICIIEELKCLNIEPHQGTLNPGESIELKLSYSHNHLKYGGIHELPILVKIEQGKMFWLDLCGRTLPAESVVPVEHPDNMVEMFLQPMVSHAGVHELTSIPVGLHAHEVPKQRFEIANPSSVDSFFEIDTAALATMLNDNYRVEIFRLPVDKGLVTKRATTYLDVYFRPLEVKEYTIELPVRYVSGSWYTRQLKDGSRTRSRRGNVNWQYTKMILRGSGYDPRLVRPVQQPALYAGGLPPSQAIVCDPEAAGALSHDRLDFGLVPQNCSGFRMTILRNQSAVNAMEFTVDDGSCYLMDAAFGSRNEGRGTVHVQPMYGRVPPLGHVVLHVSFNGATSPIAFEERITVLVKQVVISHAKKRGNDALLKAKAKKSGGSKTTDVHDSVVMTNTATRSIAMAVNQFGMQAGKTAKLPVTVDASGRVVVEGGGGAAGKKNTMFQDLPSSPSRSMGGDDAVVGFDDTSTHNTDGGKSQASATTDSLGRPGTQSTETGMRPGSAASAGSRGSSRSGHAKETVLLGPGKELILRVAGEVFTHNIVTGLLGTGPAQLPPASGLEAGTPQRQPGAPDRVLDTYVAPIVPLFVKPPAVPSADAIATSGSRGTPVEDPGPVPQPSKEAVKRALHGRRKHELKGAGTDILDDMLRELVMSEDMTLFSTQVLMEETGKLEMCRDRGESVVLGKPTFGLYFGELVAPLPLRTRFIALMKNLALGDDIDAVSDLIDDFDSVHSEASRVAPEPVEKTTIDEPWVTFRDRVSVKDFSWRATKEQMLEACSELGFDKRGDLFKVLLAVFEDKYENKNIVRPAVILNGLSLVAQTKLTKALTTWETRQRRPLPEATPEPTASSLASDVFQEDGDAEEEDDEAYTAGGDSVSGSMAETEDSSTVDPTEEEEALNILQRNFRAAKGRTETEKLRTAAVTKAAKLALVRNDVFDLAADVLRNTMFNLVQEASYEEFSIDAEPLKYMIKKEAKEAQ